MAYRAKLIEKVRDASL